MPSDTEIFDPQAAGKAMLAGRQVMGLKGSE
jgi:hypothetical protein